ncbi:hypothetical protein D3C87_1546530 [compost metagenome]
MNRCYGYEFRAVLLILVIQIRLVLEEVRIKFFLGQLRIRQNVVGKFLDFQLDALFLQKRSNSLQNFCMRFWRCANYQGYRFCRRFSGGLCGSIRSRSVRSRRICSVISFIVVAASCQHQYQGQTEECEQYFFHL